MYKNAMILVLCLLMSSLSYSQDGYPKLIVVGTDTLVQLTVKQMKSLNLAKLDLEYNKMMVTQLEELTGTLRTNIGLKDSAIVLLNGMKVIQEDRIRTANELLAEVKAAIKKADRKIRWLKVQRGIFGVVMVAEAIVIGIFTAKQFS